MRFWCNLTVWLQFRPKTLVSFLQQLFKYKTLIVNQESSTASDFEFPFKPLLGPSPELMQPQPSLRVIQGSIVWRQHMRGACGRRKWEVLGRRNHYKAKIALAVPAWHCTVHRTLFYRPVGKIRWSKFENTPQKDGTYCTHCTVPSDRLCTSLIKIKIHQFLARHQYN